jgi:hypothetical protein
VIEADRPGAKTRRMLGVVIPRYAAELDPHLRSRMARPESTGKKLAVPGEKLSLCMEAPRSRTHRGRGSPGHTGLIAPSVARPDRRRVEPGPTGSTSTSRVRRTVRSRSSESSPTAIRPSKQPVCGGSQEGSSYCGISCSRVRMSSPHRSRTACSGSAEPMIASPIRTASTPIRSSSSICSRLE